MSKKEGHGGHSLDFGKKGTETNTGHLEPYTPPSDFDKTKGKGVGASHFRSSSERFPEVKNAPGPGEYVGDGSTFNVKKGSKPDMSRGSGHTLDFGKHGVPVETAHIEPYTPPSDFDKAKGKGMSASHFRSSSERFPEVKNAPGPGEYVGDGSTFKSSKAREDPAFRSGKERFEAPKQGPGPGEYVSSTDTFKAPKKSGTPPPVVDRERLTFDKKEDTPGPGTHEVASAFDDARKKKEASAAYRSSSERLPQARTGSPGPGDYEVARPERRGSGPKSSSFGSGSSERLPIRPSDTPGPGHVEVPTTLKADKKPSASSLSKVDRFKTP